MTGNKRFKIKLSHIGELMECETKTILATADIAEELIPLCDLLNEQHETITDLTENLSVTSNREMRKDYVIERLQKENEELKKDIQDKEEIIELYQGFCGKGDDKNDRNNRRNI